MSAAEGAPITEPIVCLEDFERLAASRVSAMARAYVSGGAGDELSLDWNRRAFDRLALLPRVLRDVSRLDTRRSLLGRELPFPILLAPTAYHRLMHPDAELATARGAGAADATLVVSTLATTSIEAIAEVATSPLWFQLYVQPDRGFTRELVARAEAAGCEALCLTVDTPVVGARNREERAGFALPADWERPHLARVGAQADHRPGEQGIWSPLLDPALSWQDVEWLRSITRLPLLLKGVLAPEDAARAVAAGAAGIIVSNHGARNLDTVPATITALPAVVEAVAGRLPVLLDGGVRRGTDVVKALALGASAVLVGRPYLWALAVAGAEGVTRAITILRAELEMAMALLGRTSLAEIDRSVLAERGF
ncbi:MAG TPA: alpha-hydroxy acid oxidase [Thermoanaerobaculia bacterium]|nr:alpha-hydroxy acid oxidase [Thermoanaerobaculia bacterium]